MGRRLGLRRCRELSLPKAGHERPIRTAGQAQPRSGLHCRRDLQPGKLFLANTAEGVVLKVLDFGISKQVSSTLGSLTRIPRTALTSAGDAVGSPFYMAPEQMRASPDVDARADIWSLGAILF